MAEILDFKNPEGEYEILFFVEEEGKTVLTGHFNLGNPDKGLEPTTTN